MKTTSWEDFKREWLATLTPEQRAAYEAEKARLRRELDNNRATGDTE